MERIFEKEGSFKGFAADLRQLSNAHRTKNEIATVSFLITSYMHHAFEVPETQFVRVSQLHCVNKCGLLRPAETL